MAIAAPKRRSNSQAAPAPSRTAPPAPKKRPRDRPKPGRPRKVDLNSPAPRKAPARRKVAPKRRPASVIPIAAGHAGRAAVAVTQLPESGLIHRLTRGRAWIGVLGVLLVGIVALNVVTLSFAASSGRVDAKNSLLGKENSMLQNRVAEKYGQAPLRHAAAGLGLKNQPDVVPQLVDAKGSDVAEAASRLAAAAPAAGAAGSAGEGAASEETSASESSEEVAAGESATGEGAIAGEESTEGSTAEGEFTPEELAIYEQEYSELLASEGVTEVPAE